MTSYPRRCCSCGVIEYGREFNERLFEFRGHLLCSFCREFWLSNEKKTGHEIDFRKFKFADYSKEEILKVQGGKTR